MVFLVQLRAPAHEIRLRVHRPLCHRRVEQALDLLLLGECRRLLLFARDIFGRPLARLVEFPQRLAMLFQRIQLRLDVGSLELVVFLLGQIALLQQFLALLTHARHLLLFRRRHRLVEKLVQQWPVSFHTPQNSSPPRRHNPPAASRNRRPTARHCHIVTGLPRGASPRQVPQKLFLQLRQVRPQRRRSRFLRQFPRGQLEHLPLLFQRRLRGIRPRAPRRGDPVRRVGSFLDAPLHFRPGRRLQHALFFAAAFAAAPAAALSSRPPASVPRLLLSVFGFPSSAIAWLS